MTSEEFAAYNIKENRKAVRSFYNDIHATEVKKQPVPQELNSALKKNSVLLKSKYANQTKLNTTKTIHRKVRSADKENLQSFS